MRAQTSRPGYWPSAEMKPSGLIYPLIARPSLGDMGYLVFVGISEFFQVVRPLSASGFAGDRLYVASGSCNTI
jgi:hypothetical protein